MVSYRIKKVGGTGSYGSYIISNTSNTITYSYNDSVSGGHLIFNAGDTYEIQRVLVLMDQNGRGKGDRVAGEPPINTTTGKASWNHEALEPCYSWNNIYTPKRQAVGFAG